MSSASSPGAEAGTGRGSAACTVLAGPNGSGKSSLYELLQPVGEFVNADTIARLAGIGSAPAARRAIDRLNDLVAERTDFVFETTLSSQHALALMRRARDAGFEVGLVFVALSSPDLNVRRVAERVARGGHHIPEDAVRRRYPRAFRNLARALSLAHGSLVYDNSEPVPQLLLRVADGIVVETRLDRTYAHHDLIARAVAEGLGSAGRGTRPHRF